MDCVDLNEYYKENHAYEFLINAVNLFDKSELNDPNKPDLRKCMTDYKCFVKGKDSEKLLQKIKEKNIDKIGVCDLPSSNLRHEILRYFRTKIVNEADEFHLLQVRLAIALELSLKGLALHKDFNIFQDKKELVKYDSVNIRSMRTYELGFFVDNLKQLLKPEEVEKYRNTFKFFREKRNEYVHFSRKQNTYHWFEMLKHFCLLDEYFIEIVKRLKEEVALLEAEKRK